MYTSIYKICSYTSLSACHHFVVLWVELELRGCRSRCNIEGDRKGIKLHLLAFDILKSSIEAFQETGTFQIILSTGSWIIFFNVGKCVQLLSFNRFSQRLSIDVKDLILEKNRVQ